MQRHSLPTPHIQAAASLCSRDTRAATPLRSPGLSTRQSPPSSTGHRRTPSSLAHPCSKPFPRTPPAPAPPTAPPAPVPMATCRPARCSGGGGAGPGAMGPRGVPWGRADPRWPAGGSGTGPGGAFPRRLRGAASPSCCRRRRRPCSRRSPRTSGPARGAPVAGTSRPCSPAPPPSRRRDTRAAAAARTMDRARRAAHAPRGHAPASGTRPICTRPSPDHAPKQVRAPLCGEGVWKQAEEEGDAHALPPGVGGGGGSALVPGRGRAPSPCACARCRGSAQRDPRGRGGAVPQRCVVPGLGWVLQGLSIVELLRGPRAAVAVALPQNYPPPPPPFRRQVSARHGPLQSPPKGWSPFEEQSAGWVRVWAWVQVQVQVIGAGVPGARGDCGSTGSEAAGAAQGRLRGCRCAPESREQKGGGTTS